MTKREEQARDYAREQAESSSYRVSKINVRDWMFGKGDFSPEAQKLACERTGRRIAKLYQDALLKAMEEEFAIPAEKLAAYKHDAAVHEAIEWAISMADDRNHPAAFPLVSLLMRIKGEA